jgi:hypothetical protein
MRVRENWLALEPCDKNGRKRPVERTGLARCGVRRLEEVHRGSTRRVWSTETARRGACLAGSARNTGTSVQLVLSPLLRGPRDGVRKFRRAGEGTAAPASNCGWTNDVRSGMQAQVGRPCSVAALVRARAGRPAGNCASTGKRNVRSS